MMMKMLTKVFNQMTKVTSTLVNIQDTILNMQEAIIIMCMTEEDPQKKVQINKVITNMNRDWNKIIEQRKKII